MAEVRRSIWNTKEWYSTLLGLRRGIPRALSLRSYFLGGCSLVFDPVALGFPLGKVVLFLLLRQVDYFVGGAIYLLLRLGGGVEPLQRYPEGSEYRDEVPRGYLLN